MDPSVQTNRRTREIIFSQAATANARASKRLTAELKTLESQQQREMLKLHKAKFRMKTAVSMPSLNAGHDDGGFLHAPISPRAPSSLPVSPITSPRIPRRRHSEVASCSTMRSLQFKYQALGNQSKNLDNNRLSRASSEGKLDDAHEKEPKFTTREMNYAGVSPRPFRRSFSDVHSSNPGMSLKGQETFVLKNRAPKLCLLPNRGRKLSAPLIAIDENRDNLDQRIKKFHESLLSYKREKEDAEDDVFEEGGAEDAEFTDSAPKLPDIKPNASRTISLPALIPRLSLANLTLNSSVGDDDSVENLKKCRYLRIPEPSELGIDEVFSQEQS